MTAQCRLAYYVAYVDSTIPPVMALLYTSAVKHVPYNFHTSLTPCPPQIMLDTLSVLLGYGNASPADGMPYPRKRNINCISAKSNNMTHSNYCIKEQLTLS
jgi:hypothetical protein